MPIAEVTNPAQIQALNPQLKSHSRPSLKMNAASSAAVMVLGILVTFFLTPAMLAELGERRYGMWTLTSSLVGYFSLLQFGLTTSVFRYVPLFRGRGEHERVSGVVSTSLLFYSFIGLLVFAVLLTTAGRISEFFKGGPELASLIRVLGFAFALELPSLILNTTLTGYEEFVKTNAIAAWSLVLRGVLLLICVWQGYGLVALGWVLVIVRIATLIPQWTLFRKVCADVHLSIKAAHWSELKMLLMFGSVIVIASTGNALAVESPKQIVGKMLSLEILAVFGVVVMLMSYFRQLIFTLTKVLTPRFSYLSGAGGEAQIASLFMRSTRYVAMLTSGLALLMWVAGPSFIVLWTRRPQMAQGVPALLILILGNWVLLSNRVSSDMLLGLGKQGLLATFELCEALAILASTLALARLFGITGVALGMAIPFAIVRGVVQPVAVCRTVKVAFWEYWRRCIGGPWLVASSLVAFVSVFRLSSYARDWVSLVLVTTVAFLAYLILSYFLVATASERLYVRNQLKLLRSHSPMRARD